ncbi:hypothetical protein ACXVWQ_10825, partial [Haemophilus sp. SZY H57]
MLLRDLPAISNPDARRMLGEMKNLLETAAVQQAESSASRRRGAASGKPADTPRNERETSVHQPDASQAKPVQERIVDNRPPRDPNDARNELTRLREANARAEEDALQYQRNPRCK